MAEAGLPRGIAELAGTEPAQLGVGRPGKCGALRLAFEERGGRTVVAEQFAEVPLCAQRAMYLDPACPGMAHVYVASASGGMLQGDRYRVDITAGAGSRAHVTTQGATRIYGMNANCAVQEIRVALDGGAYLELVPDQIIPYAGSRFYQRARLEVHEAATLVYSEAVVPGRTAMGEAFEYDVCHVRTSATDQRGRLRFADAACLEPGRQRLGAPGALGGRQVFASVYVLAPAGVVAGLHGDVCGALADSPGVAAGASVMRDGAGILARILGDGTEQVRDAVFRVVSRAREASIGAPFAGVRK